MRNGQVLSVIRIVQLIMLSLLLHGLGGHALYAHEIRPAIVDLHIHTECSECSELKGPDLESDVANSRQVSASLLFNLESLLADMGAEHDDTNDSPNSELYDSLRALSSTALANRFADFESTFKHGLKIQNQLGKVVLLKDLQLSIPQPGDLNLPRHSTLEFNLMINPGDTTISWQWDERFGEIIVRADDEANDFQFAALLAAGQRSSQIALGQLRPQSVASTIASYIVVGFQHILPKGLDHILFVVGLFLLSTHLKGLLLQITVFTIAHTVTLVLATLGLIAISASVVEPLIALSIVYVALENIVLKEPGKWRLLIVFCFGLLHGLGFASVLGAVGLDSQHFLIALLAFNIGVEFGQLFVIFLCFVVLWWWVRKTWYRKIIVVPGSLLLAVIGTGWFVERLLG